MWSLGCIFVEMMTGKTPFPGDSEIDQLFQIFETLGTPNSQNWPGVQYLRDYRNTFPKWNFRTEHVKTIWKRLGTDGISLALELLTYLPEHRVTARVALTDRFFRNKPLRYLMVSHLVAKDLNNGHDATEGM